MIPPGLDFEPAHLRFLVTLSRPSSRQKDPGNAHDALHRQGDHADLRDGHTGRSRDRHGLDRSNPIEAAAREQAWTGTAHGLIAELGVGAVTHSTLQLGLALTGLFAGLGLVLMVAGAGLVWTSRGKDTVVPDTVPDAFVTDSIEGTDTLATV